MQQASWRCRNRRRLRMLVRDVDGLTVDPLEMLHDRSVGSSQHRGWPIGGETEPPQYRDAAGARSRRTAPSPTGIGELRLDSRPSRLVAAGWVGVESGIARGVAVARGVALARGVAVARDVVGGSSDVPGGGAVRCWTRVIGPAGRRRVCPVGRASTSRGVGVRSGGRARRHRTQRIRRARSPGRWRCRRGSCRTVRRSHTPHR